jgi:hypothetical protein
MAIINSFPKGQPSLSDTLLGTKYEEGEDPATKQFSVQDILNLAITEPSSNSYLSYVVFVDQDGTSNPTAQVLQNNTGTTATWTRFQAGGYELTFSESVVSDQSKIWYSNSNNQSGTKNVMEVVSSTSIVLLNFNDSGVLTDGISLAPIEIRFYQ